MIDNNFCTSLEAAIQKGLSNTGDAKTMNLWCDGVLPPVFESEYSSKFVNDNRKITMTAFIGFDAQSKYELTLYFGKKALSRYARGLDITACIPDPDADNWFEIDMVQHKISIRLY